MKRLGREILAGAGYGIAVALAYVMVEFTLVTLVPLITQPATKLGDPFWHALALLLIGYIGCGAVLGAVAGALFAALGPADSSSQQRLLAATLLLPVVFAGNLLVHWPLSGGGAISVGIAALLLAALIVSINS